MGVRTRKGSRTYADAAAPPPSPPPAKNEPRKDTKKSLNAQDIHLEYEFGGPIGTLAMMVFFPVLMFYFYVCLWFFDGHLVYPTSLDHLRPWLHEMLRYASTASPTLYSAEVYLGFMAFQLGLAFVMPGVYQEGLPVASLGGKKLVYHCNALASFYATCIVTAAVHFSGLFRLDQLIDHFGPIMSTAMITGFTLALVCYVATVTFGQPVRMSGNVIYDYCMGAVLNPRIGIVDIKMWCEVRIPWVLLFILSLAGCARQYDTYGYVSANQAFLVLSTGLYINSCAKGEECIPQTWDMTYEKFGWLLSFWNLAGVPFMYCYGIIYMATRDPVVYRLPLPVVVALYVTLLVSHYFFDTAMAQKSKFKSSEQGNFKTRKTFPQWPYSYIENPRYLETPTGSKLLVDGWWRYVRKPNYSADFIQNFTWALITGFGSPIPYYQPFFFLLMLIHRCNRDFAKCAHKYGKVWEEYCRTVPYKFIPGIY